MICSSVNRDFFIDASNSPPSDKLCAFRWIRNREQVSRAVYAAQVAKDRFGAV
jgi:hypothetical protein